MPPAAEPVRVGHLEPPAGQRVEFRCPEPSFSHSGRRYAGPLFAVAVLEGPASGVLEYACQRCKQRIARTGRPVARVIHRYSLAGALLVTLTEDRPLV